MKIMMGPSNVQYIHYSGNIWVSKEVQEGNGFNVAILENSNLRVLGYTQGELDKAVRSILKSYGWYDHVISRMLADEEEIATCSICRRNFYEGDVNMTDYEDDVCIVCEPRYKSR